MKKKFLLVIVIMTFILGQVGIYNLINKGKNNLEIPQVKLKEQENKNDTFAIMIEQSDGTYKETTSTSFNQSGYLYNSTKSGCIDVTGQKLDNALNYDGITKQIIVRTNSTAFCYIYFDIKAKDVEIELKTDGESGKLPTTGGYKNTLVCSEGIGTFNNKYQRLEITDVKAKCTLNYEKDISTHTKLVDKIVSLAGTTQGVGKLEELTEDNSVITSEVTLEHSNYNNLNNDTTYPWTWNETDKTWTSSNKGDESNSTTSAITFSPNVDGSYQICYIQSSQEFADYGKVYKNNTEILSLKDKFNTSYECKILGNLSTTDTIKVTYQKDGSGSVEKDEMAFYIQTGTYNERFDSAYRYEGQNPNNYIWFNNEMWRIIGAIPTKVDASGTTTNLVKIIRSDSLGGMVYDISNNHTGEWGNNTLYTLLNEYYYGKKDGTKSEYCYEKCDYRVKGISSDSKDYYGRMVKNVYWNTGASDYDVTASAAYINEKTKQTVQGRIGLMSASDYGYAASKSFHDKQLYSVYEYSSYASPNVTLSNWLYSQGYELTSTQDSCSGDCQALSVNVDGMVEFVTSGANFRPVLYLNENVYVISGNGTEAEPYIIGM